MSPGYSSVCSSGRVTSVGGAGTAADHGTGMGTRRPVKTIDPSRLSSEFVGSLRKEGDPKGPRRISSETARAGEVMVDDVILPILSNTIRDDMDAREIESLSMLQRGFAELKDANPQLAHDVILDILQGINDNSSVKQDVQTSRGLLPHNRESEMTSKGSVVTEELSGLPPTSASSILSPDTPSSPSRKSPIAELLYTRWLEGLKLKWPSMMS